VEHLKASESGWTHKGETTVRNVAGFRGEEVNYASRRVLQDDVVVRFESVRKYRALALSTCTRQFLHFCTRQSASLLQPDAGVRTGLPFAARGDRAGAPERAFFARDPVDPGARTTNSDEFCSPGLHAESARALADKKCARAPAPVCKFWTLQ
jgi:hypothetical protein